MSPTLTGSVRFPYALSHFPLTSWSARSVS